MTEKAKGSRKIKNTLSQLKEQVLEMTGNDKKHSRLILGIKLFLLLFIVIYLGWAYKSFKPLDAKFLVFVAQEKINESLPTARQRMADHLTKLAPSIVDQIGREMLKNIPTLEKNAEAVAKKTLLKLSDTFEKDFLSLTSSFFEVKKNTIDEMFPNMSSFDKITSMRKFVIDDLDFFKDIGFEVGESIRIHPFKDQLSHLATGKNLTPKEQLQRDVLAIWYILVQKKLEEL